jgi:thiol-disulfide isomerase/thioredoxin
MLRSIRRRGVAWCGFVLLGCAAAEAFAAKPTPAAALALKPIQVDVDYETPPAAEMEKCSVQQTSGQDASGWVVLDATAHMLRRFVDTNNDNKLDQWCYYKNGIEVYRDMDTNYNGKADQYRWMGTEGIRWGLDDDEDGRIDRWKAISAEEATAEVVAALKARDAAQFQRLLLTAAELDGLGLGDVQKREIAKKVAAAARGFTELARKQTTVTAESQWLHFGAGRPGVVPIGTDGSTKDVVVYDNVSAVIQTGSKHAQLNVGSMVHVGDCWRLIDLPQDLLDSQSTSLAGGFFFQLPAQRAPRAAATGGAPTEKVQELLRQLEDVEKKIQATASAEKTAELNTARAGVLEQLMDGAASQEDRDVWTRQFADTVSAAVQAGRYPAGVDRLRKLAAKLARDPEASKHVAHLAFLIITAEYAQSLQGPAENLPKVQEKYLADLGKFVQDYAQSEDAAEALLQLAVAEELSGKSEQAVAWYRKIVEQFPKSEPAKKAAGARRRLESVGQPLQLQGTTLDGKQVALAAYRGRAVLVHYWASWCEPCKQDMELLQRLQAKYAKQGFALIGVNIDSDRAAAVAYLTNNPLPWPQLYESGGLDSRLAVDLGILTLPTMILVDKEGKVLNRNIHASELDEELGKRLR